MMIAFDIDGCMNSIKEDIMRLGNRFFSSKNGIKFHEDGYYLRQIYQGAPEEMYEQFWAVYGYEIYTNPPKDHVHETIEWVKQNGIEACLITTRDTSKHFNGISFDLITRNWLKEYDIELPVYYRKDKDNAARELGVDLMVEDKPANIEKLQKVTDVLIYRHPYNRHMDGKFVTDWKEILEHIKGFADITS